jgi:hypothetical protein
MFKDIKKKYRSSSFKKGLVAIKTNPILLFYVILLDVGFFGVFYLLNLVLNNFLPDNAQIAMTLSSQSMFFIVMLLISILYFVVIILAYSFFNLIILGSIRKMAHKYSHDFSLFKNMFFLNLLLFIIFFILLSLFNYLTVLIVNKSIWLAAIVFLVVLVLVIFSYAFHNFSHSAFILGHKLRTTLKQALKNTFSKAYLGVITFSIVFMIIYFGLYILLGLIIDNFIIQNYNAFINTSSIITLIVAYVLFTFNRIYFFFVAEKRIGKA